MQGGDLMKLNLDGLETQKWNSATDRPQRVVDENGIICLVIMFTPRIMVIKMLEMAHFLYILLMTAKNQSQFEQHI